MTETVASDARAGLVADVPSLQQRAAELAREAEAATRHYDRSAWIRYVALWVPIPLLVLAFKLRLEVWHYFFLGALFIAAAAAIYAIEMKAVARRDRALEAADAARATYEDALRAAARD